MPEDPKPAPTKQPVGTANPADSPKPPDSLRARDLEHPKHSKVGDVPPPKAFIRPQRDDLGRLINDPRPDESEESKRLRREAPAAPGTSSLPSDQDPEKAIKIAQDVSKFIDEQKEVDPGILQKQVRKAVQLNQTVARASQLRKRVDPDIEYPTKRLDPKLKDSDAQLAVARAGMEER